MDLATYVGVFIGATVFLALEPGPGFIKLSSDAVQKGRIAATLAAFGMALGALPYIAIVSVGFDALVGAMPGMLAVLKFAGCAYLIWQASMLLRRRPGTDEAATGSHLGARPSLFRSLSDGFLLVFLNPRTPVLYAAFPALFLRQDAVIAPGTQLLLLGVAVASIFLIVDLAFVALARSAGQRLRASSGVQRVARYVGASLLLLFGARLLFSRV